MIDKEMVRARLGSFVDLFTRECPGYDLRRAGSHFVVPCPFHEERTASFHVYEDHGHCFGCGWNGDHFALIEAARGLSFKESLELAASWAGVSLSYARTVPDERHRGRNVRKPVASVRGSSLAEKGKVTFPPGARRLTDAEVAQLAALRGLSVDGIAAARDDRRVGFSNWPYRREHQTPCADRSDRAPVGGQATSADVGRVANFPSWVVTDRAAWVAQYRRLDGGEYAIQQGERSIKAWTNGTPTWPVGAAEIGAKPSVMLVEGGADMLAAYHFLLLMGGAELLARVAVVCVLGASNRLCVESLPFFKGKRVRIFIDADKAKAKPLRPAAGELEARSRELGPHSPEWCRWYDALSEKERADYESAVLLKAQQVEVEMMPFDAVTGLPNQPKGWKVPSLEAAARWGGQLRDAGAVVCTMQLYGLFEKDGKRVGDLNDLALCEESVWMEKDVREGFLKWDF